MDWDSGRTTCGLVKAIATQKITFIFAIFPSNVDYIYTYFGSFKLVLLQSKFLAQSLHKGVWLSHHVKCAFRRAMKKWSQRNLEGVEFNVNSCYSAWTFSWYCSRKAWWSCVTLLGSYCLQEDVEKVILSELYPSWLYSCLGHCSFPVVF